MQNELVWFIGIVLFVLVVSTRIFLKGRLPKYASKPILTNSEKDFLRALTIAVDNIYEIFPQVAVAKLIDAPYRSLVWNKTAQKSVDFVLVEKRDFSTKLVIELDDFSHKFANRMERDALVNKVLSNAKIPVLHYPNKRHYNPVEIGDAIQQSFQKK